ncbi:MAG: dockerin type I repeat-containing protein [Clostridiales bacterium]|nr:dockerin type I repeat-containing protein [Clostridiales bacterium]
MRSGVGASDGSDLSGLKNEFFNIYDGSEFDDYITTNEEFETGEYFYPKAGDKYHIELSRLNNGYYASVEILAVGDGNAEYADRVVGRSFSYTYGFEEDPLTVQDEASIYAGFFAARYASITVTNIDIYESSKKTDLNLAEGNTALTPAAEVVSELSPSSPNYNLELKTNNKNGGTVIVKLDDEIMANGVSVGTEVTSIPLSLTRGRTYRLVISYTPSKKDSLTSYDTVITSYELHCSADVNGDGSEDLTDAVAILQYVNSPAVSEAEETEPADVNGNGVIDETDAAQLLKNLIKEN